MSGRIVDVPAVAEAASAVIETRRRLAACPPASPMWRVYSVEAEGAWQKLHETVGRSSSACLLAVMEMAGES